MFSTKSSQTGLGRRMLVLLLAIVMLAGVMGVPAAADDTADGYDAAPEAITEETTEETAEETAEDTSEETTTEETAEEDPAGEPAEHSALPEAGSYTDELPLDGERLSIDYYRSGKSVWWDATDGSKGLGANAGVSAVTLSDGSSNNVAIGNANSNDAYGLPAGVSVGRFFGSSPSANTSRTLTITAAAGYYVTNLVVACVPMSGVIPYQCSTWQAHNAHTAAFTLSNSSLVNGSYTLTTSLSALAFCHDSNINNNGSLGYFVLIKVAPVPKPLYVEYDAALPFTASDNSVFKGSEWLSANAGNSYGTGRVLTANTQFEYSYTDPSQVASWKHFAGALSETALAEAEAAGYEFDGWKATWYNNCIRTDSTLAFSDVNSTGDSHIAAGSQVALPTHVRLVAQWKRIEQPATGSITLVKRVYGLTEAEARALIGRSGLILCDGSAVSLDAAALVQQTGTDGQTYYEVSSTSSGLTLGTYTFSEPDAKLDGYNWTLDETSQQTVTLTKEQPGQTVVFTNRYTAAGDASSANYIVVQKTFTGITASQIPENFTLSVTPPSASPTPLARQDAVVTNNGLTWTWLLPVGYDIGSYDIAESGTVIENYTWTASGTGTGLSGAAARLDYSRFTHCSEKTWPVDLDTAIFAAKLTANGGTAVISKTALSDVQKKLVADVLSRAGGGWEKPTFYTADALDGTHFTYAAKAVAIDATSSWAQIITMSIPSDTPTFTVTNAYTADPATGSLRFTKIVEGLPEGDSSEITYSFRLLKDTLGATLEKVRDFTLTVTGNGSKDITFTDLEPGQYYVEEIAVSDLTLSDGQYYCTTTSPVNGAVTAGGTAELSITNTYHKYLPELVSVGVTKKLAGEGIPVANDSYSFELTAKDNAPLPAGASNGTATVSIIHEGSTVFSPIVFDREGVYVYELRELSGSDPLCTYDSTVYTVTVTVTAKVTGTDTHILAAAIAVTKPGEGDAPVSVEKAEFTNTYREDKYITVTKSFSGVTKEDIPADFAITVKAPDNTVYTLRKGDSYFEDATAPNGAPVWKWTLPSGGGKYDVSESNAEIDGYILSATGFGRSIEVANQGSLLLSNSYSVPTVDVTIRKILSGGTSDGTFAIEWDVDGLMGDTLDIKAGKTITIRNVPIGATLTVKEHLGSGSGYTTTIGYDGKTVSGTQAVFTITDAKDQTVTVTNTFKPAAVTLPQIEKKITGEAPEKAETYTFKLTAKRGAPLPADSTVTITGSGRVSFPAVTFTEAGTYLYEIEEVKGSDKNCTYDKTVYKIEVIVTAKADGTLCAEMSVTAGGKAAGAVVFTNHYTQPKNGGKTPPSTGDSSRPLLWLALAVLAAAALSGTAVYLRRKKNGSR